jgi:hypothetical protein
VIEGRGKQIISDQIECYQEEGNQDGKKQRQLIADFGKQPASPPFSGGICNDGPDRSPVIG